jgi:uncharacterized membrane protein SirB2
MKLAKEHTSKRRVITFSILAHCVECILVITPLFICLLTNGVANENIFNWLVILLGTLIYPISVGVVMIIILKTDNKKPTVSEKVEQHA